MTPEIPNIQVELEGIARRATYSMVKKLGLRIRRVVLIGSVASGEAGPDSDVDLGVVVPTWRELEGGQFEQRLAAHLVADGMTAGHRAGGVHLHLFDESFLQQNALGSIPELDESTQGVIESIRHGRVLHG